MFNQNKKEDSFMLPSTYSKNYQGFFPTVFNDFFNDGWMKLQLRNAAPAMNVAEDEKAYRVEVAAPGMTKEDFKLSVEDGYLLIAMEKRTQSNEEQNARKYLRREFGYSKFEQRLVLPEQVEREKISARMTDGVLVIDIPKQMPEEKANECKYIEIQ